MQAVLGGLAGLTLIVPMSVVEHAAAVEGVAVEAVAVNDCWSDDSGNPLLTALDVTPATVDVRDAAQVVTIHANAEDTGGPGAATGVARISVQLASPASIDEDVGPEVEPVSLTPDGAGAWTGQVRLPRRTTPGTWRVGYVTMADAAKGFVNERSYIGNDLDGAGFSTDFDVVSVEDETHPVLTGFNLSRTHVNTRKRARTIRVTARLHDHDSGLRSVSVLAVENGTQRFAEVALAHHGSRGADERWTGRLRIARWVTDGTWSLYVSARNQAMLGKTWSTRNGALRRMGLPSVLHVRSGSDSRRPSAAKFHRSTDVVDTRTADRSIDVRLRATDATSGVGRVRVTVEGPGGYGRVSRWLHRSTGTVRAGSWTGTVPLRRCAGAAGTWTAQVRVYDRSGKHRTLKSVPGLGFTMLSGDHQGPSLRSLTDRVRPEEPVVIEFDEDVAGITTETIVVRKDAFPTGEPLAGTWSCTDSMDATSDCAAGPVRHASFRPAAPFAVAEHDIELNPEHHSGVMDMAGNPGLPQWIYNFLVRTDA